MIAADLDVLAAVDDVEIVATLVIRSELTEEFLVGVAQEREPHVREHDSPPIRRVARILFVDANLMARVVLFHQQRQVQSSRSSADDGNFHDRSPRSSGRAVRYAVSSAG